jgi:hypothetical protein
MMTLLNEKVITLDLFDEHGIHEVTDPADPTRRYCLCRSPRSGSTTHATDEKPARSCSCATRDCYVVPRQFLPCGRR